MNNFILKKDNILIYMLYIFSFLLPISQKFSTIIIVIWLALSIFLTKPKHYFSLKPLGLLPILYIIFITSLIYSDNYNFKYFEQRASLIAFPVIFFINNHRYNNHIIKNSLRTFLYGCFLSVIFCYIHAIYSSITLVEGSIIFKPQIDSTLGFIDSSIKGGNYFYGNHFSIFHHTTYYAMYLCFAISILLFDRNLIKNNKTRILLSVFFSLIVIQVSSKAGIFTLIIILIYFIYQKFEIKKFIIINVISLFLVVPFLFLIPRMKVMINDLYNNGINFHNEDVSSTSLRLMTWSASMEILKKHPILGVGLGDAYIELVNEYKKNRYVTPYRERLNSHNQYLQLFIESGVLAFIVFLYQLIFLFKENKNINFLSKILTAFLIIIIINCFFESVLNRYSGLAFYSFMFCLFAVYNSNNKTLKNLHEDYTRKI